MELSFSHIPLEINGSIQLPRSKSISNRLLMLKAYSEEDFEIENLSEAEDTKILNYILSDWKNSKISKSYDVGHAGTAMRFLISFFAKQEGFEIELMGSERMHKRPVGILVNTLENFGANIQYLKKTDYPPLRIKGKKMLPEEKRHCSRGFSSGDKCGEPDTCRGRPWHSVRA